MKFYSTVKPYIFITLTGLFLLLEMGLQVSVSVITPELMHDLHISAVGIGFISSFFFYSYTVMQIPGGMLFDCISAKKVISVSIFCCAVGSLLFGISTTITVASAGRFLIGLGSSIAWISVLYIASQWFQHKYFAIITGLAMIVASLGAMGGQMPLVVLNDHLGWRNSILLLSLIGFILSVLIFIFLEDKTIKKKFTVHEFNVLKNNFLKILNKKQTWAIGVFAFFIWAPITAFASLWGVPFLKTAYQLNHETSAFACSVIWIGVAIGSPLLGWWSEKIQKRILPLVIGSLIGTASSFLVIYLHLPLFLLYICLTLTGIAAGGQALSFALIKDSTNNNLMGTAIGVNNMAVVASGFIFQPLIGIMLNWFLKNSSTDTIIYSTTDYRYALFIIPLAFLISFLVSISFIKESYNKL
ncbi:MAG TPA: MFS transporter [Victivallales bacterium]|nr:MFS transporter [Victivallales bacterium]